MVCFRFGCLIIFALLLLSQGLVPRAEAQAIRQRRVAVIITGDDADHAPISARAEEFYRSRGYEIISFHGGHEDPLPTRERLQARLAQYSPIDDLAIEINAHGASALSSVGSGVPTTWRYPEFGYRGINGVSSEDLRNAVFDEIANRSPQMRTTVVSLACMGGGLATAFQHIANAQVYSASPEDYFGISLVGQHPYSFTDAFRRALAQGASHVEAFLRASSTYYGAVRNTFRETLSASIEYENILIPHSSIDEAILNWCGNHDTQFQGQRSLSDQSERASISAADPQRFMNSARRGVFAQRQNILAILTQQITPQCPQGGFADRLRRRNTKVVSIRRRALRSYFDTIQFLRRQLQSSPQNTVSVRAQLGTLLSSFASRCGSLTDAQLLSSPQLQECTSLLREQRQQLSALSNRWWQIRNALRPMPNINLPLPRLSRHWQSDNLNSTNRSLNSFNNERLFTGANTTGVIESMNEVYSQDLAQPYCENLIRIHRRLTFETHCFENFFASGSDEAWARVLYLDRLGSQTAPPVLSFTPRGPDSAMPVQAPLPTPAHSAPATAE